jgi:hypothetical protein
VPALTLPSKAQMQNTMADPSGKAGAVCTRWSCVNALTARNRASTTIVCQRVMQVGRLADRGLQRWKEAVTESKRERRGAQRTFAGTGVLSGVSSSVLVSMTAATNL